MIKSIFIETLFTDTDLYERFALVKELGLSHIEFGGWTHLDISRVQALQKQHGIGVSCISGVGQYSLTNPDEREGFLEHLSQSLAVAKYFSCPNLVIQAAPRHGDRSAADQSEFTSIAAATRALLDAVAKAERAGKILLLAPVSTYENPESHMSTTPSAGDIIRVVNSPHLRLLYDVCQMQAMEGDILRTVRKYRDLIGYVHIGEATDGADTCEVNLDVFKKVLVEELGYKGFVGFLPGGCGSWANSLEALCQM